MITTVERLITDLIPLVNTIYDYSGMYQFHDLRSMHPGGVNSVYADGRVSLTSVSTELKMLRLLLNRMDGEMVVSP